MVDEVLIEEMILILDQALEGLAQAYQGSRQEGFRLWQLAKKRYEDLVADLQEERT